MYVPSLNKNIFYFFLLLILVTGCKKDKEKVTVENQKKEVKSEIVEKKVTNQKLTPEQQIASAVLAAPIEVRKEAKVYGYDEDGNFITLREGTNEMICIADNPSKDGFEVVSYHKDLDPYMARGRQLKLEGKSPSERSEIREKEAKEGVLTVPSKPATLHILFGKNGWFDIDSNKVRNAKYRYVVYIPFATQKSTGLSLKPNAPGHPWLMFPGKANAHIMITPAANENK